MNSNTPNKPQQASGAPARSLCARNSRIATSRDVADELWRMAKEYQAQAAKLGVPPEIGQRIVELVVAAHKAKACARTVVGASIAACRSATDSKSGNPTAGKKTSAAAAPSAAQIARTMRNARNRSARRPASGAEISRIIVARDNVRPRRSGSAPCNESNSGKKGEATPNAA
jgi:hypothetical protein